MRVLLVDDEEMVRELLHSVLADAHHEVLSAANGLEALKILGARPIDLVITDILMPDKEGVETILEIRQKHPHTRIIAISGGSRTKNFVPLQIASRAGADLVLQKPIEPDHLLAAVRRVMEKPSRAGPAVIG